ncbi:MAG: alkaline phosphatase D family protein [Chitinophagales bacterium]|nr:alkaline phosphatase D family protein [Chitinophagales bacterium]
MRYLSFFCFIFLYGSLFAQWNQLPANMYADSVHAPFYYGVASGDPLADRVIIWTHVTPDSATIDTIQLGWEVATDSTFANVVQSGQASTDSSVSWTVKVDVTGLSASTTYYYRFKDAQNRYTPIGRTRTAPNGPKSNLQLAVISCSSVFSGFFNAYRQIGLRNDLDLVIHLGDYVYDFIDEDEEVRVPDPYAQPPGNIQEWRDRERYYLLDPDFRLARQQHPFSIMWDNHDLADNDKDVCTKAFLEWTPTRVINQTDPKRIYRKMSYGDLLDIFILDIMLWRDQETLPNGEESLLGTEQWDWFMDAFTNSTAQWKIIGSQKMFSYWGVSGPLATFIPTQNGVLNLGTWDGYQLQRKELLDTIANRGINNVIVISGDSHVSLAADLTRDPQGDSEYDPETGSGGLGVEFLPTSVTRGNFDELGIPTSLQSFIIDLSTQSNPHHRYVELVQHGYGILDIKPDSAIAQFWYCPILQTTNDQVMGKEMVTLNGMNHWKRPGQTIDTTTSAVFVAAKSFGIGDVFPNPVGEKLNIDIHSDKTQTLKVSIYELETFKKVTQVYQQEVSAKKKTLLGVDTSKLGNGIYIVYIEGKDGAAARTFLKR